MSIAVCLSCKTEYERWDGFTPCGACGGKVQEFYQNKITPELIKYIDEKIIQIETTEHPKTNEE